MQLKILITCQLLLKIETLCNNNILGLIVLILLVVPSSTNRNLIKGTNNCFGEVKLDYDILTWNLDQIFELDLGTFVFKCGVCCVRKFVTSLDSRSPHSATPFEKLVIEFGTWNWDLASNLYDVQLWNHN